MHHILTPCSLETGSEIHLFQIKKMQMVVMITVAMALLEMMMMIMIMVMMW